MTKKYPLVGEHTKGIEEGRALIEAYDNKQFDRDDFRTFTEWIVGLIEEFKKTAYPYNLEIENIVLKELGLPEERRHGGVSHFVYTAQDEVHRREKERQDLQDFAEGWIQPDQEWLNNHAGSRVEVLVRGTNILGFDAVAKKVSRITMDTKNVAWVMKPRSRTKAYQKGSVKVRLISRQREQLARSI